MVFSWRVHVVFRTIHDLRCDCSAFTLSEPLNFYLANFLQRAILFPGGHYDCYNSAHQTPPPITFTFILSNYRSRLLFQEESELSSKRWASAPRRPDSPCVLGAPTSREVSQSPFYPEFSFNVPEINVETRHICFLENISADANLFYLML